MTVEHMNSMNQDEEIKRRVTIDFGAADKLAAHAHRQAKLYFGGNMSAYIRSLVDRDTAPVRSPRGEYIRMFGAAYRFAAEAGVATSSTPNATDIVFPKHKIGVSFADSFDIASGESQLVASMVVAHDRAGCNEFWLVVSEGISSQDMIRFRILASTFPYGRVHVIPFGELRQRISALGQ